MRAIPHAEDRDAQWDEFCATAPMATLLHRRRFLAYHGARFADESLWIEDDAGTSIGLLPAARDPSCASTVVSHPGATYGGFVHAGALLGGRMMEALDAVCVHYRALGFRRFRYHAVPHIYHVWPSEDDRYALHRAGAERTRCLLSAAIDLGARRTPGSQRLRHARKAVREGVTVVRDGALTAEFWTVLEENLRERHEARPVHNIEEITHLMTRFPDEIVLRAALAEGVVVAGVLLFLSERVAHAQYIAANRRGRELHALDAVFEDCIQEAAASGLRFFDFGTSNEQGGAVLNAGLYAFKAGFGGGGVAYETYELTI